MGRALSQDLRDRVIAATGSGTSVRKAASRFEVGVSTAIKWVRRLRDTGERSARRQGRRPGSKLDAHGEFVRAVIDAVPDTTIAERSAASLTSGACTPAPARSGPSSTAAT